MGDTTPETILARLAEIYPEYGVTRQLDGSWWWGDTQFSLKNLPWNPLRKDQVGQAQAFELMERECLEVEHDRIDYYWRVFYSPSDISECEAHEDLATAICLAVLSKYGK